MLIYKIKYIFIYLLNFFMGVAQKGVPDARQVHPSSRNEYIRPESSLQSVTVDQNTFTGLHPCVILMKSIQVTKLVIPEITSTQHSRHAICNFQYIVTCNNLQHTQKKYTEKIRKSIQVTKLVKPEITSTQHSAHVICDV